MTGIRLMSGGLVLALLLCGCGRDDFAEIDVDGPVGPGPDECRVDRDCPRGEFCDAGTCRDDIVDPQVCREGAFRCLDSDTLGFCPDGDGFEVWEDCSDFGGFCDDGACQERPPACRAGTLRCGPDGNVELCNGEEWEDLGTCPPNSRCSDGECIGTNLPDIEVIFADVNPPEVEQGGTLDVGLEVVNNSEVRTGGFECQFSLATGRPNPDRDVVLERLRMGPLGGFEGEGVGLRVQIPQNVAARPYTAYVFCDARNEVRESDENNNIATAGDIFVLPNEGRPDLQIVDLSAQVGGVVDAGESIQMDVVVCNQGDAVSNPSSVRVHAVPDPNGDQVSQLMGDAPLARLAPGDCTELTIRTAQFECFEPPVFFLRAVVDPQNRVQESNERNNISVFGRPIELVCEMMECTGDEFDPDDRRDPPLLEPDLPHSLVLCPDDLDIFELAWSPGGSGGLLLFSPDPDLRFTVRIQSIEGDRVTVLAGGATEGGLFEYFNEDLPRVDRFQVTISGGVPEEGGFYDLIISGGDVMPEGPDLTVSNVSMTPEPFQPGEQKSVVYTVSNLGGEGAGSFSTGIAIVEGFVRNPQFEDLRFLARTQTRGVPAGESRTQRSIVTLPDNLEPGSYTVVAYADIGMQIREDNENNNTGVEFFEIGEQPECEEDPFEPNDSFAAAFTVESESYPDLVVCANDDDYYRICPGEPGVLSIELRFDHDQGDVDMQLLDEMRQVVDRSNGVDDTENIDFEVADANQCYVLRVFLFGQFGTANRYDMNLDFEGGNNNTCTDPLEPNNGFESASDLGEAADLDALDFCPQGDPDFYIVSLERGDTLTLGVAAGTMDPGSISVTLYGPNRGFLLQRFEREPVITYQAATAGEHFIRLVTSSGADRFPYNFTEFSIE